MFPLIGNYIHVSFAALFFAFPKMPHKMLCFFHQKSYLPCMTEKKVKKRADCLVHEQGLAESREQAKRLIMAGQVFLDSTPLVTDHEAADGAVFAREARVRVDKAGHLYATNTVFCIAARERFASRGAYKLLTGLEYFSRDVLDVAGLVCLDAGASTGGFTDCLLQHGAARVYAVDVGHGQLHEKLRNDPRVINLEKTNIRTAPPELIPEQVHLVVADVSFISLTLILPACMQWLTPGGSMLVLIKPQFEVGPEHNHKGVVRSEEARQAAIEKVTNFCIDELSLHFHGLVPSTIRGPKGNQEYIALFKRV